MSRVKWFPIVAMLVLVTGRSAEARLFGWTYGGGCCVDRFRYFGCSLATGRHGQTCPYKGYAMPRQYCTGTYGLISICCAPCWNVSPGYSFCGNIWSSFLCTSHCYRCPRLAYGPKGLFACHKPHACQEGVCRAGCPPPGVLLDPAAGSEHLYRMLYATGSVRGCCGPTCNQPSVAALPTPSLRFNRPQSSLGRVRLSPAAASTRTGFGSNAAPAPPALPPLEDVPPELVDPGSF